MANVKHTRKKKSGTDQHEKILEALRTGGQAINRFKVFYNVDELFEVVPPIIQHAREYSELLVRSKTVPAVDRQRIRDHWGWTDDQFKVEITYEEFQKQRVTILFGNAADTHLVKKFDQLDTSEVDRAQAFFIESTGIPLRVRKQSLANILGVLQRIATTTT